MTQRPGENMLGGFLLSDPENGRKINGWQGHTAAYNSSCEDYKGALTNCTVRERRKGTIKAIYQERAYLSGIGRHTCKSLSAIPRCYLEVCELNVSLW